MDSRPESTRSRFGSVLIYLFSLVLVVSAAVKFAHVSKVAAQMAAIGFSGSKLTLIAALEAVSALLFAFPRTRAFGLLMVSAYLGGAVAAHVGNNQLPLQPAIVLALIWLAAWLRHPQALWSAGAPSRLGTAHQPGD